MTLGAAWPKRKPRGVKPNDHGWLADGTVKVLQRHLRPDTKTIVELGVWLGKSTRFFLEQCPDATVYSVDLWDIEHLTQWAKGKHPHLIEAAQKPLKTFMVNLWEQRHRVIPMQMDSIEAISKLKEAGVEPDIIYLDTSHLYPETLHEVRAIKKAFPNCQLVGDDWLWGNKKHGQAVERSVREYVQEAPHWSIEQEGNGWALVPSYEGLLRHYNRRLEEYLGHKPLNWAISPMQGRAMLREFNDRNAKVIVELGAGYSSLVFRHWASQVGARIYSVDTDPRWLEWVKSLLEEQRLPTNDILTLDDFRALSEPNMADVVFIDHGTDNDHATRIRDMPWASDMAKPAGILLVDDLRTHATPNKSLRYSRRVTETLQNLGWTVEVLEGCRASETAKGIGLAQRSAT